MRKYLEAYVFAKTETDRAYYGKLLKTYPFK